MTATSEPLRQLTADAGASPRDEGDAERAIDLGLRHRPHCTSGARPDHDEERGGDARIAAAIASTRSAALNGFCKNPSTPSPAARRWISSPL